MYNNKYNITSDELCNIVKNSYYFTGNVFSDRVRYCERFLELVIDLEALLLTRRFFNTVMDDCHLVVRCQLSNLLKRPEGGLFGQVSTNIFKLLL